MMRRIVVPIIALGMLLLTALPAAAVTDGQPDGTDHPYVGLAVFYDEDGNPTHRCSGTLISANVFLTAGHCTYQTAFAQVWFDPVVVRSTDGETGYP